MNFDLRQQASSREAQSDRWTRRVGVFLASFAAAIGILTIANSQDWIGVSSPAALFIGFGGTILFLTVGLLLVWTFRSVPVSMVLDGQGVLFSRADGTGWGLRWTDSGKSLTVGTVSRIYPNDPAPTVVIRAVGKHSRRAYLSLEAYEALVIAARAHGFRVDENSAGPAASLTTFGRARN